MSCPCSRAMITDGEGWSERGDVMEFDGEARETI